MAAPLVFMWAPARAFIGSAAAGTRSLLAYSVGRRKRHLALPSRDSAAAAVDMLDGGSRSRKVVVIAGNAVRIDSLHGVVMR